LLTFLAGDWDWKTESAAGNLLCRLVVGSCSFNSTHTKFSDIVAQQGLSEWSHASYSEKALFAVTGDTATGYLKAVAGNKLDYGTISATSGGEDLRAIVIVRDDGTTTADLPPVAWIDENIGGQSIVGNGTDNLDFSWATNFLTMTSTIDSYYNAGLAELLDGTWNWPTETAAKNIRMKLLMGAVNAAPDYTHANVSDILAGDHSEYDGATYVPDVPLGTCSEVAGGEQYGTANIQLDTYFRRCHRGVGGVNVSFGGVHTVPPPWWEGLGIQSGVWNSVVVETKALVDLDGESSSMSVTVTATSTDSVSVSGSGQAVESLLSDYVVGTGGAGWTVAFSNLAEDVYRIWIYAPADPGDPEAGVPPPYPTGSIQLTDDEGTRTLANATGGSLILIPGKNGTTHRFATGAVGAAGTMTLSGAGAVTTGVAAIQLERAGGSLWVEPHGTSPWNTETARGILLYRMVGASPVAGNDIPVCLIQRAVGDDPMDASLKLRANGAKAPMRVAFPTNVATFI